MPLYDNEHMEHKINTGNIVVVADGGRRIPAYWAHPEFGNKFSGIALLHDWWGVTSMMRRLANFFAQMGYYVIMPDFFEGHQATTPQEAIRLVEQYKRDSYLRVDACLTVLETHHMCNGDVAAIGVGLGGSLAFEASITRDDLEAAIAYSGFPQNYTGQFKTAHAPILALFGSKEPFTKPPVITALRKELSQADLKDKHRIEIIDGLGHEFFTEDDDPSQRARARQALKYTLSFLEQHLHPPERRAREIV